MVTVIGVNSFNWHSWMQPIQCNDIPHKYSVFTSVRVLPTCETQKLPMTVTFVCEVFPLRLFFSQQWLPIIIHTDELIRCSTIFVVERSEEKKKSIYGQKTCASELFCGSRSCWNGHSELWSGIKFEINLATKEIHTIQNGSIQVT